MARITLRLLEQRFGRLVVVGESDKIHHSGSKVWVCECDCGTRLEVPSRYLMDRPSGPGLKSCGCLRKRRGADHPNFKHGHKVNGKHSPTLNSYRAMIARCYDETSPAFRFYGARGVRVCRQWKNSFENFLADLGERPDGMTLDRIDPFKGYSKQNCKWSTREEQDQNKRADHLDILDEDLTPLNF